ncbi:Vhr1-domain-containing protein [Hanseniaspora valbyensis NRRL Y-1626]|uniref:Vhr1-domain-containing protein n=1 Tax=Hanseniaspora valbyensis NRRL Y-1626 TaxID=766949 RepID=A0A1B7T9M7_9ASCO|nr:Vhr1-domain-containing protein [Hanseniaspora valbyensis NRRL Y-1626]
MAKSANGTTYKIREQLQFLDNKKWKLFSTRRLELIDRFKLFEKKASEQDCNIERIANILRTEFDYSIEHQLDFEKLVTAAVQSVRRNRKRSKHLNNHCSNNNNINNVINKENGNIMINNNDKKDHMSSSSTSSSTSGSPALTKIKHEIDHTGNINIPSASIMSSSSLTSNNKVTKIQKLSSKHISNSNLIQSQDHNNPVIVSIAASHRNNNTHSGSDSDSNKIPSPSTSPITSPLQLTRNSPLLFQTSLLESNSANNNNSNNTMLPSAATSSNTTTTLPSLSGNRITLPPLQNLKNNKQTKPKMTKTSKLEGSSIEIVKNIISDIVFQKISLKEQLLKSTNSNTNSPFSNTLTTTTNNNNNNNHSTNTNISSNGDLSLEFFALSSHNRDLLPIALKQPNNKIKGTSITPSSSIAASSIPPKQQKTYSCPFFLKSKMLTQINNSKTCHDICSKQGSYRDIYSNILEMGTLGYTSCLMFIFERFHGMNMAMVSYLKDKLLTGDKAEERLIQIIENLFENATLRNLHNLKPEFKMDLFKLCIGSLIKDFGFDPVIYPLGEIFQDYILKDLSPFINGVPSSGEQLNQSLTSNSSSNTYNLKSNTKSSSNTLAHSMIVSTAPLDPTMANNSIYRTVVIKKGDKKQEFTFYPLSNGTPTISEILENCSVLFGLTNSFIMPSSSSSTINSSSNKVDELLQKGNERNIHSNALLVKKQNKGMCGKYGLYHQNQLLKSDIELSTLLTNFGLDSREIVLDIKEFGSGTTPVSSRGGSISPQNGNLIGQDGLTILSSAAFVSSNQTS